MVHWIIIIKDFFKVTNESKKKLWSITKQYAMSCKVGSEGNLDFDFDFLLFLAGFCVASNELVSSIIDVPGAGFCDASGFSGCFFSLDCGVTLAYNSA